MSQQMIKKISVYIISLLFVMNCCIPEAGAQNQPPDTVIIPLKIRAGVDIAGPAIYLYDKNNLNIEGYFSCDLNAKTGIFLGAGYSDYKYSQYNYDYLSNGYFIKTGVDFNILKPEKSMGKYWAGIGLRYGLSYFTSEIPSFEHESYWGTTTTTIAPESNLGHYLEVSPGFRAEVFNNFSLGWSLNLRKLLFSGTGKDLRPIYFPGYGSGDETISFGINYFLTWNIPFMKIKVSVKQEEPEETEEIEETEEGLGF